MAADNPFFIPGARVVVVNDSVTQLNLLSGLLKKGGFNPLPFKSVEAALDAMHRETPPALFVTDLYMPGIDGWRFCHLLRSPEYRQFNQTPILVVSATFSGDEPSRITSELGANAFLNMPVDGKQFLDLVQALLRGEKQQGKLKVLVLENNSTLSARLVKSFLDHGYEVHAAFTCQDGLTMVWNESYDIAVLDYHLPDGLGDGLLKDIQKKSPDCVCLLTIAEGHPELALSWMEKGAATYLLKPYDPEYLLAQCERARRERSLLRIQDLLEERTNQLIESEARFRYAMEATNDGLWDWDIPSGKVYYSPAYLGMLGFAAGELPATYKTWLDLVHPDDRDSTLAVNQACIRHEVDTFEVEFRMRAKDGTYRWILSRGHALRRDANGQALQMIGTQVDISKRKQVEAELKKNEFFLNTILHTAKDGFWVFNKEGNLMDANQAYCEMSGYSLAELTQMNIRGLEVQEEPDKTSAHLKRLIETGFERFETRHRRKDGSIYDVEISVTYIAEDGGRLICFCRDISERKQAEARLNEQLEELRRWHNVTLGREKRIIELKGEVNRVLVEAGEPLRYPSVGDPGHE